MKNDAFERQIKNLFEHEERAIDTDQLWTAIEDRVDGKKKKRRFFFWLFFGTGLLALVIALWPASPAAPTAQSSQSIEEKAFSTVKTDRPPSTSREQASITESNESLIPLTTNPKKAVLSPPPSRFSKTGLLASNSAESSQVLITDKVEEELLNEKEKEIPLVRQENRLLSTIRSMDAKRLNGPPLQLSWQMLQYEERKPSPPKRRKSRKIKPRSRWSHAIDLYAGPDATLRHIKPRSSFFGETLERYRNDDERSIGGFNFGAQYKLYHYRGWMLTGGLEYRQVDERFRLVEEMEETSVVTGVVSVVVNAQNDTIRQNLGSKEITRITTRERVAYNHYRSLNASFGTGYKQNSGKWRIEWVGGVDINLSASMEGSLRDATGNVFRLNTRSGFADLLGRKVYRNRVGMGVWGSASFARTFSNGMTLFATPYLRQQLGSLTSEEYPLIHRHTTLGLKLGGRIYLQKKK